MDIYLIIFSLPVPGEQRGDTLITADIFNVLYMRPLPGANSPALGNVCRLFAPFLACVAYWERGNSGALRSCFLFLLLARPNSPLSFPY